MVKAVYFVLLLAIILNVTVAQNLDNIGDEFRKKSDDHKKICLKQYPSVNENTINALRKEEWGKVDNDENAKCFVLCYLNQNQEVYDKSKITDYYMGFIKNVMKNEENYKKLQNECDSKRHFGKDDCKGAYEAFKCFAKYKATIL